MHDRCHAPRVRDTRGASPGGRSAVVRREERGHTAAHSRGDGKCARQRALGIVRQAQPRVHHAAASHARFEGLSHGGGVRRRSGAALRSRRCEGARVPRRRSHDVRHAEGAARLGSGVRGAVGGARRRCAHASRRAHRELRGRAGNSRGGQRQCGRDGRARRRWRGRLRSRLRRQERSRQARTPLGPSHRRRGARDRQIRREGNAQRHAESGDGVVEGGCEPHPLGSPRRVRGAAHVRLHALIQAGERFARTPGQR